MEALARSSVPMSQIAFSRACHKNIGRLKLLGCGSPCQASDWHVIVLIERLQSVGQLSGLCVVNAGHSVTITSRQVLVIIAVLHAEDLCITIAQSHFGCDLAHLSVWLGDPLLAICLDHVVVSESLNWNVLHLFEVSLNLNYKLTHLD